MKKDSRKQSGVIELKNSKNETVLIITPIDDDEFEVRSVIPRQTVSAVFVETGTGFENFSKGDVRHHRAETFVLSSEDK